MSLITSRNLSEPKLHPAWFHHVKASLAAFVGANHPLLGVLEVDCPEPHAVHQVYSLGLRDIAEGKDLFQSARRRGWRFLAGGYPSVGVGGGCHVTDELADVPWKVLGTLEAREIVELLENTKKLNELPEVTRNASNIFEVRVLRIPGLYLEGFWLRQTHGRGGDLMVPYGLLLEGDDVKLPERKRLRRMKALPMDTFLSTIRPSAQKRLEFNDAPHAVQ